MPNWSEISDEIASAEAGGIEDAAGYVRNKYMLALSEHTGRNVIAYYSGWLTLEARPSGIEIDDDDKGGFMTAVHKLHRPNGLDLILHTPGGNIAAAESIVFYLREQFGTDIRVIVPQIAMSAGTMIACSAQSIVLGKQSSLGPIDPHLNGISAPAVLEEFDRAVRMVQENPASIPLWQTIVGKYHPTFLDSCRRSRDMSKQIVQSWLTSGMFAGDADAAQKAQTISEKLSNHDEHKEHGRHIHFDVCEALGLKITRLESDPDLQDLVLSVHHAFHHTCRRSRVVKVIENHNGSSWVKTIE
ncbi:SDH family Clp fold serine proteinase [Pandoraea sp. PE-S2T-3]|uniref:SDH family Clp fold serine proteinase n=1 Tax=Pandoraea sp. PE-S2T-3 TaxID=1986993 RepID=UPI000B3FB45E|nr:serine protease [Pandoraea sp. PE-S2T-3]